MVVQRILYALEISGVHELNCIHWRNDVLLRPEELQRLIRKGENPIWYAKSNITANRPSYSAGTRLAGKAAVRASSVWSPLSV